MTMKVQNDLGSNLCVVPQSSITVMVINFGVEKHCLE